MTLPHWGLLRHGKRKSDSYYNQHNLKKVWATPSLYRESRGVALLILNLGARWSSVLNSRPGRRFTPFKEQWAPLNGRLRGPHSRSGRFGGKKTPLPGFESRNVEFVAYYLYRLCYRSIRFNKIAKNILNNKK